MNTWKGLSKKLKENETCSAHFKCFEQWMTLRKAGIANQATIDEKQQKWLHRNLAFRGSDTAIGSKSNGNFLGVFELLAKYDTVLNELMQRIQDKETKEHYLSNDTQNELIRLLAREIESKNLSKVKKAKYYSVILDCTPDVSHKEQMSIILRSVTCTPGVGIDISENFFGYLTVNDTTGKGLFNAFLNQAKNWDLNILDCRGQSYDNGANMKGKVKGVQARFLEMNPKALYVPCANHSLNLVIVDEILEALEKLEEHALEKRDGATFTKVRSLTEYIRTWPFLLSIIIWHDVLFQINKSSKLLQSSATSLDILASEINATKAFLYEYRENVFSDARVKASEIAEVLGIEKCADHTWQPEHQYKADFFLPLIDMSIASVKERFEQIRIVTKLYDFLYRSESLIKACNKNSLSAYCKNLQIKLADIDFEDLESESTMVDERLSSLAMLSVENEVARTLSYEGIINEFASMKTRRKPFF
ncbi:zinc finger MYM-type protein 1-like [Hydra vulgaris]|uniref:Zinc finger MYM-type protein 1-like n=1 Tax=Hydra vulgaris TaxID=6087 RepID=A0ABM4CBA3_HYDVU